MHSGNKPVDAIVASEDRVSLAASDGAQAATALSQFISFAIGSNQYGVDIMAARGIRGWSEITHLPGQPD
jgi:purine-binding chemotaxis protein CheW